MKQEKETNLVAVAFQEEIGISELSINDLPEPVHGRAVRDVRWIGWSRATGEGNNKLAEGVVDYGSRIAASGERTGVVVVR